MPAPEEEGTETRVGSNISSARQRLAVDRRAGSALVLGNKRGHTVEAAADSDSGSDGVATTDDDSDDSGAGADSSVMPSSQDSNDDTNANASHDSDDDSSDNDLSEARTDAKAEEDDTVNDSEEGDDESSAEDSKDDAETETPKKKGKRKAKGHKKRSPPGGKTQEAIPDMSRAACWDVIQKTPEHITKPLSKKLFSAVEAAKDYIWHVLHDTQVVSEQKWFTVLQDFKIAYLFLLHCVCFFHCWIVNSISWHPDSV